MKHLDAMNNYLAVPLCGNFSNRDPLTMQHVNHQNETPCHAKKLFSCSHCDKKFTNRDPLRVKHDKHTHSPLSINETEASSTKTTDIVRRSAGYLNFRWWSEPLGMSLKAEKDHETPLISQQHLLTSFIVGSKALQSNHFYLTECQCCQIQSSNILIC